jgi:FkbM family methyltransferase
MQVLVLNPHRAIVQGRHGLFLVNRNDVYIGRALELYGEYNEIEADLLHRLVAPGDVVVEAGANIGSHTVGLAKAVGPGGIVHAMEPQPAVFALLASQIALNGLDHVRLHQVGLGASDGEIALPEIDYGRRGNFGGIALGSGTRTVPLRRVDTLVGERKVALIKVDVEGMERDVLIGAETIIRRDWPRLYIENDRHDASVALLETLLAWDYRIYWHIPPLYNPKNHFNNAENVFGKVASFNVLCVHRSESIQVTGLREIQNANEPHPLAPKS